ncbi:MAG: hypothetical protein PHR21_09760, partial [Oscillospiraceae bacterium]|nr:hypothetical protein [Oscillospiraceae bacterium]
MTALAKRGRRLRILLGALICLWSAYCLLSASANLSQCLSAVSLRYQTPLDPSLAYASRVYAYQQGSAQPFWPTFWSEGSITVQVAGQTAAEPAAAEDAAA